MKKLSEMSAAMKRKISNIGMRFQRSNGTRPLDDDNDDYRKESSPAASEMQPILAEPSSNPMLKVLTF
jgi:hypothetical protein